MHGPWTYYATSAPKRQRIGHLGMGRPIMPPMPWQGIGGMSDEDLAAVYAYLKSLPPIKNAVTGPLSLDDYFAK